MADDPPAIGACWDPLAGRLAASAVHVGGAWLFFFFAGFSRPPACHKLEGRQVEPCPRGRLWVSVAVDEG